MHSLSIFTLNDKTPVTVYLVVCVTYRTYQNVYLFLNSVILYKIKPKSPAWQTVNDVTISLLNNK